MGLVPGRRAVVTGGASGIGLATCRRLAAEGAAVAVLDVDGPAAEAAAAEVGGPALVADVADPAALEAAFAAAESALGGLDTVVNNAGAGAVLPLADYPDRLWDRLMDVNLRGTFNGIRAAAGRLGPGGVIVNVASVNGLRPARGEGPYSAAKAAVIALTASAALEYAPRLRVNCVSPGLIETPLTALVTGDPALRASVDAGTPLGRPGTAEEVAAVICFLCSELAAYVTGVNVPVDGGSLLVNAQVDPMLRRLLGQDG